MTARTMPEAPEIPEATSDFEKKIALTIAMLAVVLSLVNNRGDASKTEAIIKTNQATDHWMYYQAKGIKGQMAGMQASLLRDLGGANLAPAGQQNATHLQEEAKRYDSEKAEIKSEAEKLQAEAGKLSKVNDRCDLAALLLQIGIVICSVAILSEWKPFWFAGIAMGVIGAIVGTTAFLM